MSYDIYMFTGYHDWPRWGSWNYSTDDDLSSEECQTSVRNTNEKTAAEQKKEIEIRKIVELTLHARDSEEIVDITLKRVFDSLISEAIFRYCMYEKLPLYVQFIQFNQKTLESLIFQVFRHSNSHKTKIMYDGIERIAREVIENVNGYSIYHRVGLIQAFIKKNDKNAKLDNNYTELMRQTLSIARLIINVIEVKTKNRKELINQLVINKQLIDEEIKKYKNGSKMKLENGRNEIKNWKIRHIKTIINFMTRDGRSALYDIFKIDSKLAKNDVRILVSEIINRHNILI